MEVEMNNLKDLLNEWKTAIKSQAPNLLLTAALNVKPQVNPSVTFPIQAITNNLDWVNVMAYDFIYDPNQPPTSTRAPAALNNPSADLSGSSGISAWIKAGVPANKLVLGLPFYGYAWNLVNPNNHGVLAQATGLIKSVDDISSDGAISYTSIVKDFISKGAKVEDYLDWL
ncbi:Class V chitinase [Bienertia sinuspersici]